MDSLVCTRRTSEDGDQPAYPIGATPLVFIVGARASSSDSLDSTFAGIDPTNGGSIREPVATLGSPREPSETTIASVAKLEHSLDSVAIVEEQDLTGAVPLRRVGTVGRASTTLPEEPT